MADPPWAPPVPPVPQPEPRKSPLTFLGLGPVPLLICAAAVAAGLVGYVLAVGERDSSSDRGASSQSGREARLRYTWTDEQCTRDDYSGVFTNTDTRTFSGRVWASAFDETGDTVRDQEVVISLAPGESETIEFVWVLDGERSTCTIDSVEWAP